MPRLGNCSDRKLTQFWAVTWLGRDAIYFIARFTVAVARRVFYETISANRSCARWNCSTLTTPSPPFFVRTH